MAMMVTQWVSGVYSPLPMAFGAVSPLRRNARYAPKSSFESYSSLTRSQSEAVRNLVEGIPRGGAGSSSQQASTAVDIAGMFELAKSVATTVWKEVIHTTPAETATKVGVFIGKQRAAANRRRNEYSSSPEKTSSAIFSPQRTLRLTLVAFVVAEVLQFLETQTAPLMGDLGERAETITATMASQWENFCRIGRSRGGLLHPDTWTNRVVLSRALQEQVEPKYQWALGAAAGFVLSPLVWSIGWTVLGWSASLYLVAETHHLLKMYTEGYYSTLKQWDSQVLFLVDDILEDLRKFVEKAIESPKETLLAMRDDIDDRIDFDFPPHVQKGILFGSLAGVISGV